MTVFLQFLITSAFKVNMNLHPHYLWNSETEYSCNHEKCRIWLHTSGIDWTVKSVRESQSRMWIVENILKCQLFDQDQGQRKGKLRLLVTNFKFYFIKHLQKQINACNGCQAVGKAVFLTPYQLLNTNTVSAAKSFNIFKIKHSLRWKKQNTIKKFKEKT